MKTNFTLVKQLLALTAIVALTLTSCKDDEEPEVDISGKYELEQAKLVDGDVNNDATTNLVIVNGNILLGGTGDIDVPAGETQITTAFVDAVLRGAAPCEAVDLTTWTYEIDLKNTGKVAFDCTSESLSEELGSWQLLNSNTTLSMSISVSFSPIAIPITISSLTITDTTLSGTIESFPMLKDASIPIGGPLDGDPNNTDPSNLNVQYISAEVTLAKAQ